MNPLKSYQPKKDQNVPFLLIAKRMGAEHGRTSSGELYLTTRAATRTRWAGRQRTTAGRVGTGEPLGWPGVAAVIMAAKPAGVDCR